MKSILETQLGIILGNASTRVLAVVIFSLFIISGAFITYSYHTQIHSQKELALSKLKCVAKSLSIQISGDSHERLCQDYINKDGIKTINQVPEYFAIHEALSNAKSVNHLTTDIYTMVFVEEKSHFEFIASSSINPYFRHVWKDFHTEHEELYKEGGQFGPYEDENGYWLSAFAPILNSKNEVVAIVQTDAPFDSFLSAARSQVLQNLMYVLIFLILVTTLIYKAIKKILSREDRLKRQVFVQHAEIQQKNNDIIASINSAKNIQNAILPSIENIKNAFPEMFIMFRPRDIVSGDFFWFMEKEEHTYFAIADCTGHGVPGAFMSMIGNTILNDLANQNKQYSAGEMLSQLDHYIVKALNKNGINANEGMDIGLCILNNKTRELQYSGAHRPLIKISENRITHYKANKFAIGGSHNLKKQFDNQIIDYKSGDKFYMYSDGYYDQFGGKSGKKYLSKRFKRLLLNAQDLTLEDQQYFLQYEFYHWKGEEEQIDDVLVAGFEIPDANTIPLKSAS